MSRPAAVAVVVLVVLLAWGLMYVGWRGRTRRQAGLPVPLSPPADLVARAQRDGVEVTYVSTTARADWLDRIAAHGLGVPGQAALLVVPEGVVLHRVGATDLLIPATAVRGARRESVRAGKAVPGAGLVVIDWALGDTVVTTALRTRHADDREPVLAQVQALATTSDQPGETS